MGFSFSLMGSTKIQKLEPLLPSCVMGWERVPKSRWGGACTKVLGLSQPANV